MSTVSTDELKSIDWKAYIERRRSLWDENYPLYIRARNSLPKEPIAVEVHGATVAATSNVTKPADLLFDDNVNRSVLLKGKVPRDAIVTATFVSSSGSSHPWDLQRPLVESGSLSFHTFDDDAGKSVFWHSSAHVLGAAMEEVLEEPLLVDGPALLEKQGFFYETYLPDTSFEFGEVKPKLDAAMQKITSSREPFLRMEVSMELAWKMFGENPFKRHFLQKLSENGTTNMLTIYRCGDFIDFCTGPHVLSLSQLSHIRVTACSGAHFLAQPTGSPLTRFYGISFPTSQGLRAWEVAVREAAKRDHRLIGKQQELFAFFSASPGGVVFLQHGTRLLNRLMEMLRKEYAVFGYEEVVTPQLFDKSLWKTSGHWDSYQDDMIPATVDEGTFLKPMNCPVHCLIYQMRPRSHRELPLRLADFTPLHRWELSGALSGLTRLRRFHQDDGHIFCALEHVQQEIENLLRMINVVYSRLDIPYHLRLSTRPEKRLGSDSDWDVAEGALSQALQQVAPQGFSLGVGDGAFYGPKIDVTVRDAAMREWQLATIQLDFQLPSRFQLSYTGVDMQQHRPVLIHRAILGSLERFMALLTEKHGGKWPFWLNPRQGIILAVYPKQSSLGGAITQQCERIATELKQHGFHVDVDSSENHINKKIKQATRLCASFCLIVGEKELADGTVAVRARESDSPLHDTRITIAELLNAWKAMMQSHA